MSSHVTFIGNLVLASSNFTTGHHRHILVDEGHEQ